MSRMPIVVMLALTACRSGGGGFVSGPGPTPAPEPPPDTRNAGQVVVDIMINNGYACTVQETRWECKGQEAWPLYVSFVDTVNPITIWWDSYEYRAFAHQCGEYAQAMKDLANGTNFIASCDDTTQMFRFNTYAPYGPDLEVVNWAREHLNQRATSIKLLDSIHAIRR